MSKLTITCNDRIFVLKPGEQFTFGRDAGCTVCLDPTDTGISRRAGSIGYESGIWWIVNQSMNRALHVVGDAGVTVPLPVATPTWQSRRAVDQSALVVLVVGSVFRHAVYVACPAVAAPPTMTEPTSSVPTRGPVRMTPGQRDALVMMVCGYLLPFPRYSPDPLNYQEVADRLGVTKKAVSKRIETFREHLVEEVEVAGLEDSDDARRRVAEWALFTRLVGPDDLTSLEERLRRPKRLGP